jgi:hypothetical protein
MEMGYFARISFPHDPTRPNKGSSPIRQNLDSITDMTTGNHPGISISPQRLAKISWRLRAGMASVMAMLFRRRLRF